jgi:SHS2 domain-containing protein
MAKHCQTFDHTADVGLDATADTLAELMEALAEGVCDVVCDRSLVAIIQKRELAVAAEDTEAMTVDFLSQVLLALQADHFLVAAVRVVRAEATSLAAELAGEPYDPSRHEIRTEVKAVTYHLLKARQEGGRWVGRVVLDL